MQNIKNIGILVSIYALMLSCMLVGASCTKNTRATTLSATVTSLNVARDGWFAYDTTKQAQIVAHSTTRAQAESELVAYYAKRTKVEDAFLVAYGAMNVAATQVDDVSLKNALDSFAKLLEILSTIDKNAPTPAAGDTTEAVHP